MASNNKMDNPSKLLKIGYEGFQVLEEEGYLGKKRAAAAPRQKAPAGPAAARPYISDCPPYQPQKPLTYQMMKPVSSEEKVTRYGAMKLHDGMMIIMDYSKRKSEAMAY